MFQTTITPKSNDLHIHIPAELVGKEIEIIAFPKKRILAKRRNKKFESILKFYSQFNFPTSQIHFTRDELHER